jgi:hypothetical protein
MMALDEKSLESIEAALNDYRAAHPADAQTQRAHALASYSVPALVAEVRRLREALTNIREVQGYLDGRVCSCMGIGCIQCIANATLAGREKELFS